MRATSHVEKSQLCWQKLATVRHAGVLKFWLAVCRPYSPYPAKPNFAGAQKSGLAPQSPEMAFGFDHAAPPMARVSWPCEPAESTCGNGESACGNGWRRRCLHKCGLLLVQSFAYFGACSGRAICAQGANIETLVGQSGDANAESSASDPEFGNAKPIFKPAASFHSCPQSGAADAPTLTRGPSQNAFAQ